MRSLKTIRRTRMNLVNFITRRPAFLFSTILLTHNCTQNCLQCTLPTQKLAEPLMSLNNIKQIVDKLDSYGTQGLTISGGEPMIHPDLPEILSYVGFKDFVYKHVLTTLYGSEKIVERTIKAVLENNLSISCSFDGFGKVADELRGAPNVSSKVMKAMELLDQENKKRKKPIPTSINLVISQLNLDQIEDVLSYIESLGWKADVDIYRWTSDNHREVEKMKIVDLEALQNKIEKVKKSPVVFTPGWLLDGYIDFLKGNFPKYCPFLSSSVFGSKFFIHPNGDVKVCIGEEIGNILHQTPKEIFQSLEWKSKKDKFLNCSGCWNTCYTITGKFSNYFHFDYFKSFGKLIAKH